MGTSYWASLSLFPYLQHEGGCEDGLRRCRKAFSAVPGHSGYSEVAATRITPEVCLVRKLFSRNALQHGATLAFLLTTYQLLYMAMPNLAY